MAEPPLPPAGGADTSNCDGEAATEPKRRRRACNNEQEELMRRKAVSPNSHSDEGSSSGLPDATPVKNSGDSGICGGAGESRLWEKASCSASEAGSATDDCCSEDGDSSLTNGSLSEGEEGSEDDTTDESAWVPNAGTMGWLKRQMRAGVDPRDILRELVPSQEEIIPPSVSGLTLWKLIANILCEGRRRDKLDHVNTLDDVVSLLQRCNKVIVLTGAGVSVSCGIPDFRSPHGLYARIACDYPDLPDPQAIFDIEYFRQNPWPFFKFAKEIYPGKFAPSPSHRFIKLLETKGKLLRNYTQNIDTLERAAGISNIVECHGSFATASCMQCNNKVRGDDIKDDIENQVIPQCAICHRESAVVKPDIVFFGENLPERFHAQMAADKDVCDLLIVMGSSLKVRPVSLIPSAIPPEVPQILINKERLPNQRFDVELLGDCDTIVRDLCVRLGWHSCSLGDGGQAADDTQPATRSSPLRQILHEDLLGEAGNGTAPVTPDIKSGNSAAAALNSPARDLSGSPLTVPCAAGVQADMVMAKSKIAVPGHPLQSSLCQRCTPEKQRTLDGDHLDDIAPVLHGNDRTGGRSGAVGGSDSASAAGICPEGSCIPALVTDCNATTAAVNRLKSCWAERLPDHSYLFVPPSKHIFPGAEFHMDDVTSSSDSHSDSSVDSDGNTAGDTDAAAETTESLKQDEQEQQLIAS